jgi:hypothetical protein
VLGGRAVRGGLRCRPGSRLEPCQPTTLAGGVAVLRLANLFEDEGGEWAYTDTIGPEGWHYQLRATMAAAIEAIMVQP